MPTSLLNLLREYKIVIPNVQRDYAQGRQTGKAPTIRENFLNKLSSINENSETLELDFVYGYIKEYPDNNEKSFIPLDGQQRLTTLFLLHWYIAVKEGHFEEAKKLLSKFTYETRHSSRVFCDKLVGFEPDDLNISIKKTIINQPWFFTAWKNDPTINSMLIMLDAIQEKFKHTKDIWPLLIGEKSRIEFHLLPMEKLGLPDDLYIKMNSRGKELTEFEHFKSRFPEILDNEQANIFSVNIDQKWSDLFWDLYKDQKNIDIAQLVDNAFLRFFRFITDILIFKNGLEVKGADDFHTFKAVYSDAENVKFLFDCLNIFSAKQSLSSDFFDSVFYVEEKDFSDNKTRLFFQNSHINLFKKCADSYDASLHTNPFSIGEQLLLYACMLHLIGTTAEFSNRIRRIRNLITNSEDTVRKEYIQSLLTTVSEIIINDKIDSDSKFNTRQVEEEERKRQFVNKNSTFKETVCKIEDHHLLQGCLAIFKLDDELDSYANIFSLIFKPNCSYDELSTALLTFGDYTQDYRYNRRRLGNHNDSTWREFFSPSNRRGDFKNTEETLSQLITHLISNSDLDVSKIVSNYIVAFEKQSDKPKDWKYYYIKYPSFRINDDGYYYWPDKFKPYECVMMRRTTLGGFHWSPFLFTLKNKFNFQLNLDNYGAPLILVKGNASVKITNLNSGFKFESIDEGSSELLNKLFKLNYLNADGIFIIKQNQYGSDIDDRVIKCAELISKIQDEI